MVAWGISAGGSAHMVVCRYKRQADILIYCKQRVQFAGLSCSAVEGVVVGIAPDMGSCMAASVSRVGRGVVVG